MNNELIPIQRSSGLYLVRHGHGDDRRFARLFRETWARIPLWARREMTKYWRGNHPCFWDAFRPHPGDSLEAVMRSPRPRVELLNGWRDKWTVISPPKRPPKRPGAEPRGHHGRSMGVVFSNGYVMRFRSGVVDLMPENIVHDLVAHELAHVCRQAVRWHDHLRGKLYERPTEGEEEWAADELVEDWGYEVESLDEWTADIGLTFRREVATLQEYFKGSRYFS